MSTRSLIGGNLNLNSLTVNNLTVTDSTTLENIVADDVTANEKLLVSNNAMILNNTTTSSSSVLLGNSGETVGEYLSAVYPESVGTDYTYTVEQLTAGDNGSQSLILTAGGAYEDDVKNTIQSYDSYRKTENSLILCSTDFY